MDRHGLPAGVRCPVSLRVVAAEPACVPRRVLSIAVETATTIDTPGRGVPPLAALPLMRHVGRPIAFNPSLPLARTARRNGWPIVVERKDVVYDIDSVRFVPVDGQTPKVPYGNRK